MNNGTWSVTVEEDEEGNAILPFPKEMMVECDWREGDTLDFQVVGEGTDAVISIKNLSWEERNPSVAEDDDK
jgi:hypothetical protein